MCRVPIVAEFWCRVMVCRVREQGHNKTGFVTKLQQNNSLDPPVHGDTSQYHSLTEEEGGLEENSGRSSLRGHAQSGQVMLNMVKIMPGHNWVQEKNKTKIMYRLYVFVYLYMYYVFQVYIYVKYKPEIVNFLRKRYLGI